jgi:serine/threonine-protein kinase
MPVLEVGVGTRLLDYRVESVLGRGGMSVVYLAEDLRLKRKIALKLLAPDLAEDERFRERFLRESALAASIDHPNVIPIYDAGEVEGVLYIAMRYVAGTDLKALLREERSLEPNRAFAIAGQIAEALDSAHAHGLVHRDVKPANVLIATQGGGEHAYLSDFGLTKSASFSTELTRAGQLLGTIDYVAPEQIRGESVDGRADQYSLGCLLFECLTGEVPFRRDAEVAVIYAHLHDAPPVASGRSTVPVGLDAVLRRAMAKKPRDRYASCGELVAEAQAALGAPRATRHRAWKFAVPVAGAALLVTGVAAGLVLALDGGRGTPPDLPAAAHPGYRVTFSERLSSGEPGVQPDLSLYAAFDDGRELRGLGSAAPPQTGEVVFRIDRQQFEQEGASGAYGLMAAPTGTQVGFFTVQPSGDDRVQIPLRKAGFSRDGAGGDTVILLKQAIPAAFQGRAAVPDENSTLRVTRDDLVLTVRLQRLVQAAAGAGIAFSYNWVGVHFFGSYFDSRVRQKGQFVRNPTEATTFTGSVSARPCTDVRCRRLGPAAHDSAQFTVPRTLTLQAPRHATYGRPAVFHGTGHTGDFVTVAYEVRPGSGPPCTPVTFESLEGCAPRFRPVLRKITETRTKVGADGRWSLALPLRSTMPQGGPYQLPPVRSASGRYVAVAYTGRRIWGPLVGGSSTLLAEAPADTAVALAKPRIEIRHQAGRRVIAVSLPGADRFVAVVVRAHGSTVAEGRMSDRGTFAANIAPRLSGRLVVRASAQGATASSASARVNSATA